MFYFQLFHPSHHADWALLSTVCNLHSKLIHSWSTALVNGTMNLLYFKTDNMYSQLLHDASKQLLIPKLYQVQVVKVNSATPLVVKSDNQSQSKFSYIVAQSISSSPQLSIMHQCHVYSYIASTDQIISYSRMGTDKKTAIRNNMEKPQQLNFLPTMDACIYYS